MTTQMIPIKNIRNKFDVRRKLDDDHVIYLAELIQSGQKLPPIQVIKDESLPGNYIFIDGRHRAAAYSVLNIENIEAIIQKHGDSISCYSAAMKANWGGALPPTVSDIVFTMSQLVESGLSGPKIRQAFPFIPGSVIVKYLQDATSNVKKRRLFSALSAVASGLTVKEAAEKHKVQEDVLKSAISGEKRSAKNNDILKEMKSVIAVRLKAANNSIAKRLETVFLKIDAGEVPIVVAEESITAWENHLTGTLRRIKDWRERAEMLRK